MEIVAATLVIMVLGVWLIRKIESEPTPEHEHDYVLRLRLIGANKEFFEQVSICVICEKVLEDADA